MENYKALVFLLFVFLVSISSVVPSATAVRRGAFALPSPIYTLLVILATFFLNFACATVYIETLGLSSMRDDVPSFGKEILNIVEIDQTKKKKLVP